MSSFVGARGTVTLWEDAGPREVEVEVTGTFYEPGDPVMGINVRELATGKVHGGLDSQDFRPNKEQDDA